MEWENRGAIRLVVGLGNPGERYRHTRHNAGALVVEELARRYGLALKQKRPADIVALAHHKGEVILARPRTFMNLSGEAVKKLRKKWRLRTEEILIIHDDIDLEKGVLRLKRSGSSGGHLGVQSIIDRLGSENFPRLRIGVGRPPEGMEAADYVLEPLEGNELELLIESGIRGADVVEIILAEGLERAMNRIN